MYYIMHVVRKGNLKKDKKFRLILSCQRSIPEICIVTPADNHCRQLTVRYRSTVCISQGSHDLQSQVCTGSRIGRNIDRSCTAGEVVYVAKTPYLTSRKVSS